MPLVGNTCNFPPSHRPHHPIHTDFTSLRRLSAITPIRPSEFSCGNCISIDSGAALVYRDRPWVAAFWQAADPLTVDGAGAESFAAFAGRVQVALDRLATLPAGSVAVFGHGQFMQALRWWIVQRPAALDVEAMRAFRAFDLAHPIANGDGFTVVHDGRTWSLA